MYLLDIELSIGTTLVTFLVVGVVDYVVHLLSRIRMLVQKGFEIDEAILAAMQGVGRSTVVNVVIFSMGFAALLFCAYKPVIDLGVLVILALSSGGFISILLVTLISPWFFAAIVPQPAVQEGEQPGGGAVPG
ncbi:putative RND superfamily exporter protein [Pseudomonas sp. BP6]|nr:putative RND superfamily exporter protein [Pseudomonas sp. BP6]MBP2289206.1 putative RND superfamily exporter protein [Pseudomonas sp. BP7]